MQNRKEIKMKIVKKIITFLLVFLMMLSILYSTILCVLMRYSNKEKMISKIEAVGVYKTIYEEIENGFENYVYQSGLEIDALDEICSEEKVKNDVLAIINSIYDDSQIKIDTTSIIDKLDKKIEEYITAQGKTLSKEEKNNIEEFEIIVANSYANKLSMYIEFAEKINEYDIKGKVDTLKLTRNIAIIVAVVIGVLIVLTNKKNIFSGIGYIGAALLASGVILTFIKIIIYGKIKIDGIVIFTESMSSLVRYLIKENLSFMNSIGIWYICIGIFIILMTSILGLDTKKPIEKHAKEVV